MNIGYARVSTEEQNLNRQIDSLKDFGVDRIFHEKISGTKKDRAELQNMLEFARKGDTIIVAELTRLSRSTKDLIALVEELEKKGINIKSLKETWLDTTTAQGKLMFTMMAGLSQFERDLISERTKEGLKSARARGRIGGRRRLPSKRTEQAVELYDTKLYSLKEIEERTGISRSTLYRRLEERSKKK